MHSQLVTNQQVSVRMADARRFRFHSERWPESERGERINIPIVICYSINAINNNNIVIVLPEVCAVR